MKKTMKIFMLAVLVICTLFAMAMVVSATDEVATSGWVMVYSDADCTVENDGTTNDLWWEFADGVLTIKNNGELNSTNLTMNPVPEWYAKENRPWHGIASQVKKVVIEAPVTQICKYAFSYLAYLETVILPENVTISLRDHNTFAGCDNLKTIGYEDTPEGVIDLRNIVGNVNQMFEDSLDYHPVTVLLPYENEITFGTKKWGCETSDITFKVAPGSPGETYANTVKANADTYAETGTLGDNNLPHTKKVTIVYYEEGECAVGGDISGEGDDNDLTWSFDLVYKTLTIDGTSTTLNWAEGVTVGWTSSGTSWTGLPWYNYIYSIKHVKVNAQITKLGEQCVFALLENLESVEFPATIKNLGSMTFIKAYNLKSFRVDGYEVPEDAVNVIDLRNFTEQGSQTFESAFTKNEVQVWLGREGAAVGVNKFAAGTPGVEFVVYPGSKGEEVARGMIASTSEFIGENITYSYYTEEECKEYYDAYMATLSADVCKSTAQYHAYGWSFDIATGAVEVYPVDYSQDSFGDNDGWNQVEFTTAAWKNFESTWKYAIKSITLRNATAEERAATSTLKDFGQFYTGFGTLPELTTLVTCAKRLGTGLTFADCTSLTTIGTTEGVIDLTGFHWDSETTDVFSGCTAITDVILPANASFTAVPANMFAGCTALTNVTILDGTSIASIDSTAFANCGALTVDVQDTDLIGTAFADKATFESSFPANSTFTYAASETPDPEPEPEPDPEPEVTLNSALVFDGYKVRLSGYNGLRGIFYMDKDVKNEGWTLYEYGTLVTTSENKANATVTFDGVNADSAVKFFTIWSKDKEWEGKILPSTSKDVDPDKNATYFAVSVVRYEDFWTNELYMTGYEIWVDAEGNYQIIYTDYSANPDHSTDYVDVSIYEMTLGMYKAGMINAEDDAENILWDTLVKGGAVTLSVANGDYALEDGITNSATGEAFGDTFRAVEVQMVDGYRPPDYNADPYTDGKSFTTDPLVFTNTGVTYTLLNDVNAGGYVMVFRVDTDETHQREDGEHYLPRSREWNEGHQSQLESDWLNLSHAGSNKTVAVPTSRPNPTFVNANVRDKITYAIIDHGVTGAEHEALDEFNVTSVVYPTTFEYCDNAVFMANTKLVSVFMKGTTPVEGVADLSNIDVVNTRYLFSGVTLIEEVILSEGAVNIGKNFGNNSGIKKVVLTDACVAVTLPDGTSTDTCFTGVTGVTLVQPSYNAAIAAAAETLGFAYVDANGNAHVAPAE